MKELAVISILCYISMYLFMFDTMIDEHYHANEPNSLDTF